MTRLWRVQTSANPRQSLPLGESIERRRVFNHMTLRVGRGLFRLWLILSVLWVVGMAFMAWESLDSIDQIETRATSKWDTSIPRNMFDGAPPDPKEYPAAKAAASKTAAEDRRSLFWRANLLTFLPPAFLLALGSTLVWAFRGFR